MTDYALLARMTATHCCVCRAPLTDSESVEHGIGPICSRRYYDPQHVPNEYQIKVALGLLQMSGLPDHIVDGFLGFVDNARGQEKENARKACNLLVHWASCHYDNKDEVFRCSALIRALGYEDLANKLEIDRTVARIEDRGNTLHVLVGTQIRFEKDLLLIPGATRTDEKVGGKSGWTIPIAQEGHFLAVLGLHYGGGLACGGGKSIWVIPHKRFSDVMAFRQKPARPNEISLTVASGKVEIHTPFDADFKDALKHAIPFWNRRWTGTAWEVDLRHLAVIKGLIQTHFGVVL